MKINVRQLLPHLPEPQPIHTIEIGGPTANERVVNQAPPTVATAPTTAPEFAITGGASSSTETSGGDIESRVPSTDNVINFADPCASSPCMFGKVCRAVNSIDNITVGGFMCTSEATMDKSINDARIIYAQLVDIYLTETFRGINTALAKSESLKAEAAAAATAAAPQSRVRTLNLKGEHRFVVNFFQMGLHFLCSSSH